ncbi:hypothetical protein Csa_021237 [Cucumis sativus]|uniref:Uncharacterized protein n=1 Tax=Cucumis sativus TaxID=3659 RepID=A0A0A0LH82_CUCSA|nr:hypothetical protein Csa_021237 [Cucumis sativus]
MVDIKSRFVPAYIRITDDLGNSFPIQIVSHTQGKWLVERNVRKHGIFKSQATTSFGEFNPNAKQFTFIGSEGLPPKHPTSSKNKVLNDEIKNGLNAKFGVLSTQKCVAKKQLCVSTTFTDAEKHVDAGVVNDAL